MFIQRDGRAPPLTVFFLSLIFVGFNASACVEFWSEEGDRASDVFIQFVQEELGENWSEKMNSKKYGYKSHSTPWKKEVIPSTRQWSSKAAREFLNILVKRVGKQNTCYLLARSLSHLKSIPHQRETMSQDILQNFKERIASYDDYMGEEETTEMMRKSLAGFTQGGLNKIKGMTQFLESYLQSKEFVIRILKRDPQNFSLTRVDEIQPVLIFLKTIIGHETLTEMMTRKKEDKKYGRYLALSKLKTLQKILQPVMNEMALVSLKIRNSLQREILELLELDYDHLFKIQKQVSLWISYSGLLAVSRVMKKSLGILFDDGFYDIEEKIKITKRESQNKKPVIKFAQQHPELFVRSSVREFLKSFQQWLSPPSQQKPHIQQKPRHRTVRNIKTNPGQMIFSFPE